MQARVRKQTGLRRLHINFNRCVSLGIFILLTLSSLLVIKPLPAAAYDPATGDYPWWDAAHVAQPPASDNITWGYTNKTTCDNKSATYNCGTYQEGAYYVFDQWGYYLRNCTSYVAWRLALTYGVNASGMGAATKWNNNAAGKGWTVDTTPEVGDIAHWEGNDSNPGSDAGHVAFVEEIGTGIHAGKVRIAEYNQSFNGNFNNTRWATADDYIDVNGPNPSGGTPVSTSSLTSKKLVKTVTSDGYHHLFSVGPNGVYETYWKPQQVAPQSGLLVALPNVSSIAVSYESDGTTQVYSATPNGIYETYWDPGVAPTTGLISNVSNAVAIKKFSAANGAQVVFSATSTALYETYWTPGVPGVTTGQLASGFSGIIDIVHSVASNGYNTIFTATGTGLYETYWLPGQAAPTTGTLATGFSDIRDIDLHISSNGYYTLFTGTSSALYETYWIPAQVAPVTGQLASGFTNVQGIVHTVASNGYHTIFTATDTSLYETYWLPGVAGVTTGQLASGFSGIKSIVQSVSADGWYAINTTDTNGVYDTYWKPAQVPVTTGQLSAY